MQAAEFVPFTPEAVAAKIEAEEYRSGAFAHGKRACPKDHTEQEKSPMEQVLYDNHLKILQEELLVALGCTEPIAIAYAGAKARQLLGEQPRRCVVKCSGNIIKNVKGVIVPNSDGMRGIDVAATLGIVGGDPERELAVLETVTPEDIAATRELVSQGFCTCELVEGVDNLYIVVELEGEEHTASIEIQEHHNNITYMVRDGQVLLDSRPQPGQEKPQEGADRMLLNVANILEFANEVRLEDVRELLERQISYNTAISDEGLKGNYGVETGRILMENAENASGLNKVRLQARAAAAAGSDARMSGCSLPVVINSGSGNQGITVTMPIVIYGKAWQVDEELLYRALVLGNLISVHQKKYIGSLSAYCGATSAATGAACGVAYMRLNQTGEQERIYQVMCDTITNSIETLGGMVCDGAKASCAAKIGLAVENALMALELSLAGNVFQPGEGMTMENPEDTIAAVGRMGRVGMKSTDVEILNIMLGN